MSRADTLHWRPGPAKAQRNETPFQGWKTADHLVFQGQNVTLEIVEKVTVEKGAYQDVKE